jgi:hypothetical protein
MGLHRAIVPTIILLLHSSVGSPARKIADMFIHVVDQYDPLEGEVPIPADVAVLLMEMFTTELDELEPDVVVEMLHGYAMSELTLLFRELLHHFLSADESNADELETLFARKIESLEQGLDLVIEGADSNFTKATDDLGRWSSWYTHLFDWLYDLRSHFEQSDLDASREDASLTDQILRELQAIVHPLEEYLNRRNVGQEDGGYIFWVNRQLCESLNLYIGSKHFDETLSLSIHTALDRIYTDILRRNDEQIEEYVAAAEWVSQEVVRESVIPSQIAALETQRLGAGRYTNTDNIDLSEFGI